MPEVETVEPKPKRKNKVPRKFKGTNGGARAGAGRKPIHVDLDVVEACGAIHSTYSETAILLGISLPTVNEYMSDEASEFHIRFNLGKAGGKQALRRRQFQAAEAGNTGMLVWLGRQWLDQKDRHELDIGGVPGRPIEIQAEVSVPVTVARLAEVGKILLEAGAFTEADVIDVEPVADAVPSKEVS